MEEVLPDASILLTQYPSRGRGKTKTTLAPVVTKKNLPAIDKYRSVDAEAE